MYLNIKWNTGCSSRKCDSVWSRIIVNTSCNILTVNMLLKVMLVYLPVAVMLLLLTRTVISVDDGLLRISIGCAGPSFLSTLYFDFPNITVIPTNIQNTNLCPCTYSNTCILRTGNGAIRYVIHYTNFDPGYIICTQGHKQGTTGEVCLRSHFVEGFMAPLFTHATQQEQECTTT